MGKDYAIALMAVLFAIVLMFVPFLYAASREQEWLIKHNCKVIHQNKPYSALQWNGIVYMPVRHEGKKFYECDNGEWH